LTDIAVPEGDSQARVHPAGEITSAIPFDLETPEPILENTMATEVLQRFCHEPGVMALPVVNSMMHPVGLITRRKTLSVFGHKFSHELNRRKGVEILMDGNPVVFDVATKIDIISRAMTARDEMFLFDPALMTRRNIYCGVLSVITLLKQMTDIQVEQAFDSNPLSRLPGNYRINHEIDFRLEHNIDFILVYADLDNFKAFNDFYSYEHGDRVIQLLAGIMRRVVTEEEFIGHIGGDDFVMILAPEGWREKVDSLLYQFSAESALMYHCNDRKQGFIIAENRQGKQVHFPLMALSMAVVPCRAGAYSSHISIAEIASEMKHLAKKVDGNSVVINRRGAG